MRRKYLLGAAVALVFTLAFLSVFFYFFMKKTPSSRSQGELQQQIRTLERKLAFTGDPDRNMERALSAEGRGDLEGALYYYKWLGKSLPEKDPRKGWAIYKEASCYYEMGNYLLAQQTLEYALNHYPGMAQVDSALFLMARIYIKLGNFDYADKTYDTLIRMFPNRAEEARQKKAQLPQNLNKVQTPPAPQSK